MHCSALPQTVSHCGGAHTGSQTWSQVPDPHPHLHLGWQPENVMSAAPGPPGAAAGGACPATILLLKKAARFVELWNLIEPSKLAVATLVASTYADIKEMTAI